MENEQFLVLMRQVAIGVSLGFVVTLVLAAGFRACPVACQAKILRIMGRKL